MPHFLNAMFLKPNKYFLESQENAHFPSRLGLAWLFLEGLAGYFYRAWPTKNEPN